MRWPLFAAWLTASVCFGWIAFLAGKSHNWSGLVIYAAMAVIFYCYAFRSLDDHRDR